MAKEIVAIKCPQCGSTKQKKLTNSNYVCLSCDTEYFINSDEITVNINQSSSTINQPSPKKYYSHYNASDLEQERASTWPVILISVVIFSCLAGFLWFKFFKSEITVAKNPHSQLTQASQNTENRLKKSEYTEVLSQLILDGFEMPTPIQIQIQQRYEGKYAGDKNNLRYQLVFKALLDDKLSDDRQLGAIDLTEYLGNANISLADAQKKVAIHYFDDAHIYLVLFSRKVFALDITNFTMNDVSNTLFSNYPALDAGIATIAPQRDKHQNYFTVLANNGDTYYVYPLINKILNKDEQYQQSRGRKDLSKNAKEITGFTFTSPSLELKESITQLIKYKRMSEFGAPEISIDKRRWARKKETTKVFVGKHNANYSLFDYDLDRVNTATDLTPDRRYFEPTILAWTDDFVLIEDQINAAKDSGYIIQAIDAETGKTRWSLESSNRKHVYRYKDGFILFDEYAKNQTAKLIGFDGKVIKEMVIHLR